jgi:hypothetical protein
VIDEGDDGSYDSASGDGVLKDSQDDWKIVFGNGTRSETTLSDQELWSPLSDERQ